MSRIVLDAVGGDHAPSEAVAGVALALQHDYIRPDEVILTGPEGDVRAAMAAASLPPEVEVVDAPDVLTSTDSPTDALRKKRNNSIAVGIGLVKAGKAGGFVSAGSTGTVVAAATVVTRSYFELDPPAQINAVGRRGLDLRIVEVAGDAAPPPALPADGEVAARLAAAAEFVRAHTVNMPQPDPMTAPPFFSQLPNFIGKPTKWSADAQGMGAVDIAYGAGRFLLRPGEWLLIRGRLPPCRFANVVLWNRYLQTFDFERRRVSLNRQQLHAGKDGRFAVVLAATNPFGSAEGEAKAKANWLDSEGRATGTLFFRFVLPDEDVEQPTTQLLGPGDDVEAALRK